MTITLSTCKILFVIVFGVILWGCSMALAMTALHYELGWNRDTGLAFIIFPSAGALLGLWLWRLLVRR